MMHEIRFTPEAIEDLKRLRKIDQKEILEEIEGQLKHEPTVETRNRKKLRPNDLAEWELRINKFRVFYDAEEPTRVVKIEAIGWKDGNTMFIQGKEYRL